MTVIRADDLRAALLKKGFREDKTHHLVYWLFDSGKKTSVKTRISYGISEYGDTLLNMVKKQLGISKPQLVDLVKCPLDHSDYVEHLLRTGRIQRDEADRIS